MVENELIQYYLVNQDLKMNKGKIASQCCHAATVDAIRNINDLKFQQWYNSIQKKIVLKSPQELLEQLERQGYISIRDKGYTQIEPNSLTVVTLGVTTREEVNDIVKDLSLL